MSPIRTIRLVALGAALLVGAGTVATAQPPARARTGQPPARQRAGERARGQRALFRGIDLTVAQRRQIRDIGLKYGDQREDLALSLRKQLDAGQRPDSATRARLRTEFQTQSRALMDRQLADLRTALTPAQRAAFDTNVTRFRERMQARTDRVRTGAARDGRAFRGGAMRSGLRGARGFAPGAFRRGAFDRPARGAYGRAFERRAFQRRAFPGPAFRDRAFWRGE